MLSLRLYLNWIYELDSQDVTTSGSGHFINLNR